ncbi:MAG: ABC transporter ATP-binding protein [Anaerolineales bacterium]
MTTVISIENLSKVYRLGQIGTGTLTDDLKVWWARQRGQPNPLLKVEQMEHGNREGADLWALRDVSFKVKQGEVLGIIGRNGAGKSTLLKILSRVTAPTFGKIKVKGRIASLLEVGTGFHPDLTGRENVYLNGAILGMDRKEIKRKFDEIVAFAEIEKFIDTPVKRYSSGMYVRLAFSVAAHLEPEILLVDEVLAVGDVAFQKKCLGRMGEIGRDGRTILFVSHYIPSIVKLCDRSLLVASGKIVMDGPSIEVAHFYLHEQAETVVYAVATSEDGKNSIELINSPKDLQVPLLGDLHLVAAVASQELLSNKVFGFQICTEQGEVLATFATRDHGIQLPARSHIQVSVDFQVPFPPGKYLLNTFLFQDNMGYVIHSATLAELEVLNTSESREYFYPPARLGTVVIEGNWSLV